MNVLVALWVDAKSRLAAWWSLRCLVTVSVDHVACQTWHVAVPSQDIFQSKRNITIDIAESKPRRDDGPRRDGTVLLGPAVLWQCFAFARSRSSPLSMVT